MMHRRIVVASLSLALSAALALTAFSGTPADVGKVRVEVGGRVFVGQLSPETPAASSQQHASPVKQSEMPTAIALSGMAPFQVHLDAADIVAPDALRDTRVTWDFGDPDGAYNVLDGFNAAHVYDKAGTYTLTRTLRSADVEKASRWTITVAASTRRTTYVSNEGDDHNDGRSPEHAVRTFDRGMLGTNGGNGEVLFRRGDRFGATRTLNLGYDDVRIGAYGDADKAKPILFTSGGGVANIIEAGGKRLIVEDLAFDAPNAKPFDKNGTPDVIVAKAEGLVVRRCTALNVDDLVNGNGVPSGVLIQDCDAPLDTGLRSYFAWVQGSKWTILGNRVANSTREHIVRVGGGEKLNVQYNEFTNLDRTKATTKPDQYDVAKGVLNVQQGDTLYVANNVLVGPSGVGPLGKADGLKNKSARWVGAIVEHNRVAGPLEVKHGASHITYRDNFLRMDDAVAFAIDGYGKDYDRNVNDLRIERNTVVNAGKSGQFLTVWGGDKNLALVGNVYVAPRLEIGANDACAVLVLEPDLGAFTTIRGNVWPVAKPVGFAHNGVHYVRSKLGDPAGYIEAGAWAKLPQVTDDRFEKIGVDDWSKTTNAGVDASRLPKPTTQQAETTR